MSSSSVLLISPFSPLTSFSPLISCYLCHPYAFRYTVGHVVVSSLLPFSCYTLVSSRVLTHHLFRKHWQQHCMWWLWFVLLTLTTFRLSNDMTIHGYMSIHGYMTASWCLQIQHRSNAKCQSPQDSQRFCFSWMWVCWVAKSFCWSRYTMSDFLLCSRWPFICS